MYSWKYLFVYIVITVTKTLADDKDASASVINYRNEKLDEGYIYEYITSNGISRREMAQFFKDTNSKNSEDVVLRVTGFYSYKDVEGKDHRVDYSADENGFVVQSNIPPKTHGGGYRGGEPPVKLPEIVKTRIYESPKSYDAKGISSDALASIGG